MATYMPDNGADIRHIQEMLGHSCISSTQVYTKVSQQGLKNLHRQSHPAVLVEAQDVKEVIKEEEENDDKS